MNIRVRFLRPRISVTIYGAPQSGSGGTAADSNQLGGELPAYYLDRTNHTGEQAIGTVTGLQTALDGKVGTFDSRLTDPRIQKHYGSTTQALCTLTGTNEILYAVALPAMQVGSDIFEFIAQLRCTSSAGTKAYTAWLNTSASLAGATLIATANITTSNSAPTLQRRFPIRTATTIQTFMNPATSFLNPYSTTTVLPSTITVPNVTLGNLYLIIACNRASSGDVAGAEFVKPIIYRA